MGMHSGPQRLETPTSFTCSDLQLIVSGSSIFPESSLPSPRVWASDPLLPPTTNSINPQCLKRHLTIPNSYPNPPRRQKINHTEEDEDSEEQHEEDNEDDDDDDEDDDEEEEEEEEVSCSSSSSVKNNNKKEDDRKISAVDIASIKRLLETVVAQQHRFFMDVLETLERSEQQRERIRADKEDKWRAEERAHRLLIENSMLLLTQTLLRGHEKTAAMMMKKKRSRNWKRGEIIQLIKIKGEMDQRLCNSRRRGSVWDDIAEAIGARGIRRDGKQCREKWDKLMASYKDVVDGKRDRDDVPYFSELHRIVVGFSNEESSFDCLA